MDQSLPKRYYYYQIYQHSLSKNWFPEGCALPTFPWQFIDEDTGNRLLLRPAGERWVITTLFEAQDHDPENIQAKHQMLPIKDTEEVIKIVEKFLGV